LLHHLLPVALAGVRRIAEGKEPSVGAEPNPNLR
jgi:hypothetical protein